MYLLPGNLLTIKGVSMAVRDDETGGTGKREVGVMGNC